MTALKAHEVERFLKNPGLTRGFFLAYGSDQGLVHETAHTLMRHFAGIGDVDPMSELVLDAATLKADPALLAVEARTQSMFGGTRRIRIRHAANSLTATLEELLADMPEAAIIAEAGNLTPRDSLRVLAEKHPMARALPCYADNARSLASLIEQGLRDNAIRADADVVPLLQSILGNDREITRRELEKLFLFAAESKSLTREDILILCGDNAALAIDAIVDAAGTGRADRLDKGLARARSAGIDTQRLLSAALNHFAWLRRVRQDVDSGTSARQALDNQRPRPHFSRRDDLEQQLRIWDDSALAGAIERLYDAVAQSRQSSALGAAIADRALLAVCVAAAHR